MNLTKQKTYRTDITLNEQASHQFFIFFTTAHFLKTILCHRTSGTFAFAATAQANAEAKAKEPLLPTLYLIPRMLNTQIKFVNSALKFRLNH